MKFDQEFRNNAVRLALEKKMPYGQLASDLGGSHTLIIELGVDKSDIGKIIGKKGKTINAIRTLLMSVASRNGLRVNLEILEEDKEPSHKESAPAEESTDSSE